MQFISTGEFHCVPWGHSNRWTGLASRMSFFMVFDRAERRWKQKTDPSERYLSIRPQSLDHSHCEVGPVWTSSWTAPGRVHNHITLCWRSYRNFVVTNRETIFSHIVMEEPCQCEKLAWAAQLTQLHEDGLQSIFLTMSNVLVERMNIAFRSIFWSLLFSLTCRTANIMSIGQRQIRKPHWASSRLLTEMMVTSPPRRMWARIIPAMESKDVLPVLRHLGDLLAFPFPRPKRPRGHHGNLWKL